MRFAIITALLLLCTTAPVAAAPSSPEPVAVTASGHSDPKAAIDRFFAGFLTREPQAAFDALFQGAPFAKNNPEEYERMKKQTGDVVTALKVIDGFDAVYDESFTPHLRRFVYLMRTDEGPFFWEVYFYRQNTAAKWTVFSIGFLDNPVALTPRHR